MKRYTIDAVNKAIRNSGDDVLREFKDECITELEPRQGSTRVLEVYLAYLQWATEHGLPGYTFWQWSQAWARLGIRKLADGTGGRRYGCRCDYGGVALGDIRTKHQVPPASLPQQWAIEQGIWLIDTAQGWDSPTEEWIQRHQLSGRISAAPARILLVGKVDVPSDGTIVEISNGAPALDIILEVLKMAGWQAIPSTRPPSDAPKQKRQA